MPTIYNDPANALLSLLNRLSIPNNRLFCYDCRIENNKFVLYGNENIPDYVGKLKQNIFCYEQGKVTIFKLFYDIVINDYNLNDGYNLCDILFIDLIPPYEKIEKGVYRLQKEHVIIRLSPAVNSFRNSEELANYRQLGYNLAKLLKH